ncbi:uncharacterized protein [Macrobrachium rosenbergii]|uniref:uncharacterized protein n=1 Tax=Macrobrachium rosenbergii TaxID=79674 RepID=UPI0034D7838B
MGQQTQIPKDCHERQGGKLHIRLMEHPRRPFGDMTAYNLEATGIIERLHRSLKAGVGERSYLGSYWACECHQTWHSTHLQQKLADVFQHAISPTSPPDTCKALEQILPAKTTYHMPRKVSVPNELQNAKYEFIRVDTHRTPISPAYLGPYHVIQRRHNAYQMTVDGRTTWGSIDSLKPAYLPDTDIQP